ncbi:transposase family protein [Streptomyces sp. NPDC059895]|uniref:transposase family protein n=1 Tax=Streptomyces sp. NPDC059895 TaxID=3346992 RepID=UPI0036531B02
MRHRLAAVLALTACAVLAGATSLLAVGEWIADAPGYVLEQVGADPDPLLPRRVLPAGTTVRRLLARIDGDALDLAVGRWLADRRLKPTGLRGLAVDGKSPRSRRTRLFPATRLPRRPETSSTPDRICRFDCLRHLVAPEPDRHSLAGTSHEVAVSLRFDRTSSVSTGLTDGALYLLRSHVVVELVLRSARCPGVPRRGRSADRSSPPRCADRVYAACRSSLSLRRRS